MRLDLRFCLSIIALGALIPWAEAASDPPKPSALSSDADDPPKGAVAESAPSTSMETPAADTPDATTANPELVAYPDGWRSYVHVKSRLSSPAHVNSSDAGGFHHVYANAAARAGHESGEFADGAIIVFDWLEMSDREGLFVEGARRRLDVMERNAARFAATGGWGFARFTGDSHTERPASPRPAQCFACHDRLKKKSLVLGRWRP